MKIISIYLHLFCGIYTHIHLLPGRWKICRSPQAFGYNSKIQITYSIRCEAGGKEEKKGTKIKINRRRWRASGHDGKRMYVNISIFNMCKSEIEWVRTREVKSEKGYKGSKRGPVSPVRERHGERNEKECNKLAVRLFSTCIKTSSGDGRLGKYCPTPQKLVLETHSHALL